MLTCYEHYSRWYHGFDTRIKGDFPPVRFLKEFDGKYSIAQMNEILVKLSDTDWRDELKKFIKKKEKEELINLWIED